MPLEYKAAQSFTKFCISPILQKTPKPSKWVPKPTILNVLVKFSAQEKPPGTRFCDLKKSNNVKYNENRGIRGQISSTVQQRQDDSRKAAYLQEPGTRAVFFSENFRSIRPVLSPPLEQNNDNKRKKMMKQTSFPGLQKFPLDKRQ